MISNTIADKLSIIKEYEELSYKFNDKIAELRLELKNICDGKCGNYLKLKIYNPSSYYDSAYDSIYMKCKICGKSEYLGTESCNFR